MQKFTINVGHNVNGRPVHNLPAVLTALYQCGFHVDCARTQLVSHEHGTEETTIAVIKLREGFHGALNSLSNASILLNQDCIAALPEDSAHGWLAGPRPYDGGFNPEYFIPWTL